MALLDIFKKKEQAAKKTARAPRKEARKEVKEKPEKKAAKPPLPPPAKTKRTSTVAYRILQGPRITEKAASLAEKNQYVFEVTAGANKPEIKRAVEDVYGINVVSVHIINIPPKKRRLGRSTGWKQGYRKAIVRIAQGQKIEILPR